MILFFPSFTLIALATSNMGYLVVGYPFQILQYIWTHSTTYVAIQNIHYPAIFFFG